MAKKPPRSQTAKTGRSQRGELSADESLKRVRQFAQRKEAFRCRCSSRTGMMLRDRVNLLYSDTPFALAGNFATLSQYADELRDAAQRALQEEAILVVVFPVCTF